MARTKRQVKKHKRRMSNPELSPTEQARRAFARKETLPPSSMSPLGTSASGVATPLIIRQMIKPRRDPDPISVTEERRSEDETYVLMDESVRNPEAAPPEAGEEAQ
jgi:hypothetical protein